jgi:hypothetical protein
MTKTAFPASEREEKRREEKRREEKSNWVF